MKMYEKIDHYREQYQGEQVCYTCGHYIQHYRCDEKRSFFYAMGCGHCVFGRVKRREPGQACDHWRSGGQEADEEDL